jgi:hypothetical protein
MRAAATRRTITIIFSSWVGDIMLGKTTRDAKRETSIAGPHGGSIGLCGLLGCFVFGIACALSLADLSNQDAALGIKGALDQGAAVAVAKLGVPGGFLNNPKVKIPLPPALDEVAKGMRMLGQGRDADELVVAMNKPYLGQRNCSSMP